MAMKKIVLLLLGLILLLFQHFIVAIEPNTQYFIFIIGILLLGVPHGAADLLVAARNADLSEKIFSKQKFFIVYLGRLVLFAGVLFLFPVAGNLLFIFFAAYHFGETDLYQFKTHTLAGKIFVISYGLVILSVILLHHFDEVKPIYQLFESGKENQAIIEWISQNRYHILTANGSIFFIATFIYFFKNRHQDNSDTGQFLVRFACILFILFNLPMLLGFTFYFVVWHSLLSLDNIVSYLRKKNTVSYKTITKQILLYSTLAIAGIGIFGLTGFMFINENAVAGYIFLGLAVLTAPHMEIMYGMYGAIRQKRNAVVS
jgi:Brp/Blh family beta-carotene 15,15'-monooxygenase